jgi:hypothetical protein
MSDDYIRAFKQSTLYRQYLQGGPSHHGIDRKELLLRKAWRSSDLVRLVAIMANYMFRSSFTNCLPHLEGEKVFGSSKWLADCPLGANNNSHRPNRVNFFHPQITIPIAEPNEVDDVHKQQLPSSSSKFPHLVFQGGLDLKESICVDI